MQMPLSLFHHYICFFVAHVQLQILLLMYSCSTITRTEDDAVSSEMTCTAANTMFNAWLCSPLQELDQLKMTHTQLKDAHAQLQEQHMELTEQHRQQTDGSAQADMVSELTQELQQLRQDLAGQRAKTMALQQVCSSAACVHVFPLHGRA